MGVFTPLHASRIDPKLQEHGSHTLRGGVSAPVSVGQTQQTTHANVRTADILHRSHMRTPSRFDTRWLFSMHIVGHTLCVRTSPMLSDLGYPLSPPSPMAFRIAFTTDRSREASAESSTTSFLVTLWIASRSPIRSSARGLPFSFALLLSSFRVRQQTPILCMNDRLIVPEGRHTCQAVYLKAASPYDTVA